MRDLLLNEKNVTSSVDGTVLFPVVVVNVLW